ncbi:DOMON-like domain-containing protein [Sphingomonas immobilis]|uniref:DOMON-like domain-containing protein n=1 Tax=Sphingomonas immobilis TaxID=3063997 RepID=A0ABT8ZUB0_9SPHN|nr:DOMON-like domain-containing protein [Sphingomonas sp. CA1-15]MDO7841166.1 DOMON-like domain-containing protein [Sphingomonas sp. CA1-15]
MAEYTLVPHPDTPPRAIDFVGVSIRQDEHGLNLCYVIGGDTAGLVIPPAAAPCRTDELWRTTCFELFVQTGATDYLEFNFSPSSAWAAYRFSDYRTGMAPADAAPRIGISDEGDALIVAVRIAAPAPPGTLAALSVVVEERDGTKSYWALAHGDGPPDFHDPDCFVAPLPAPEPA